MGEGFLVVDPSLFTHQKQAIELHERIGRFKGWPHPDGVRWVLPVHDPTETKVKWLSGGWPEGSVEIPR